MTPIETSKPSLPRLQDPAPRTDGQAAAQPFAGLLAPATRQDAAGTQSLLAEPGSAAAGMDMPVLRTFLDIRLQADAVAAPPEPPPLAMLPEGAAGRSEDAAALGLGAASPDDRPSSADLFRSVAWQPDTAPPPPGAQAQARPAQPIPLRAAPVAGRAALSPPPAVAIEAASGTPRGAGGAQPARPGSQAMSTSPLQVSLQASQLGVDVVVRLGAAGAEDRARLEEDIAALLAAYGLRINSIDISAPQAVSSQRGPA